MKLADVIFGTPAALSEILEARSARAGRQKELLTRDGARSLVSFSMNIAGEVKSFPLCLCAFDEGLSEIRARIPAGEILHFEESRENTGPQAFFVLSSDAATVKKNMAAIEESHPLGRLFDIDVLGTDGVPLSRSALGLSPRSCLICGENAKLCARNRSHSIELVLWRTAQILNDFFRNRAADMAASCAVRALLYEVSTTPKPGLVDRNNSGSHKDMDFFTFLDSSAALIPWFRDFFCIGWDYHGETDSQLFARLRFAGQEAEKSMFTATGGVNTHKGLVFAFAILCGALGKLAGDEPAGMAAPLDSREVLAVCRRLGEFSLSDFERAKKPATIGRPELSGPQSGAPTPALRTSGPAPAAFEPATPQTAGERCHAAYGLTGARGEAAAGFPSALIYGLPALKRFLGEGFSLNDASALALLSMLSQVDDTNMIHRGGRFLALESKKAAGAILSEITPSTFREQLAGLDAAFIRRNLSPGGCADLLAVSLMFYFLETCGMVTPFPERPDSE